MTTEQLTSLATRSSPDADRLAHAVAQHWQGELENKLAHGENVLSSVEVDLDARLRFGKGIIVLTGRRLLARGPGESDWRDWPLAAGLRLQHHDHAGVGHLELLDDTARLAAW